MEETNTKVLEAAKAVLAANDRGSYTVPAGDLYPHQWLWDSCFTAIGLAHLDVDRAKAELTSLIRGQWANGMVPHIIFSDKKRDINQRSQEGWLNPHAPNGLITSGLTQPPLLAEAVVRIGKKLSLPERRSWYRQMYPHILHYHKWLYKDRAKDGLIILLHPYESGLDNSPAWSFELHTKAWPWWLKVLKKLKITAALSLFRRDTRQVPSAQRADNAEGLAAWALIRKLSRKAYDSRAILKSPKLAVADLAFNCIFIRANAHLQTIAKTIGQELPDELLKQMQESEIALEHLWDEQSGQYFSGDALTSHLIMEPTIATLLPLYAGCISAERAQQLVSMLGKRNLFKANWPVPSVPLGSSSFSPIRYWQGPTWVNTNWLIIDGLKRSGFGDEAESLRQKTIDMVAKSGCYEYFNPLNGSPEGANNFSWTAALTIDLIKH